MKENSSIHLSIVMLESIVNKTLDLEKHPDIKLHIEQCETCGAYLRNAEERALAQAQAPAAAEGPEDPHSKTDEIKINPPSKTKDVQGLLSGLRSHKPVMALLILLVLIAGGIIFFKPPFLMGDHPVKGVSSFVMALNGARLQSSAAVIPCNSGDTLRFGIKSPKAHYYYVLYQNDGGAIQCYLPEYADVAEQAGNPPGDLLPHTIILDTGWKKETLFCILSENRLSFLEAVVLVNRFLRKELPNDRPLIETFYLNNHS